MKRLGTTLSAISACGIDPAFQIAFSVKDKNAVSAELLERAVINAKEKAAVLSKAAGVKLGVIQRIDYSWGELHLESDSIFDCILRMFNNKPSQSIDVEPENIDVTDTVAVVWSIEQL